MYDLLIKNGTVVRPGGTEATTVAVTDGKIAAHGVFDEAKAQSVVDADGMLVMPGAVDIHVHFSEPGRDWEGFETGSRMLAAGGITTYMDMPLNGIPSTITTENAEEKAALGQKKSILDFGLWGGLVPGGIEHIPAMAAQGIRAFKAFMSPSGNPEFERADDETLFQGMQVIAEHGGILGLHAESAPVVSVLSRQLEEEGRTEADDYLASRPVEAELEAVQRALVFAKQTGCPLHFVHISSAEAVEVIQRARAAGQDVTLETCAHYLMFDHEALRTHGAEAKCAPPLREAPVQQELVSRWKQGDIDMVTSDHSPCPVKLKEGGLWQAWGGISSGPYTLLSVLELTAKHGLPWEQAAGWTAEKPAERFGLHKKGSLEEGKDADLVLVDLHEETAVGRETMHMRHKHSLFEGHRFPYRIHSVWQRGLEIYNGKTDTFTKRKGKWLQE
ncbi:allantoinase AllB [Marinococcus halophilus]|uniref:Allantoinase n=1 Tax=Marinococcus halophilus TaxID=1371 RepID=A0A510Y694_MARHA|nr:allantoinase AllB [Marinococcus halophilus]OZT80530.1 allantoinase AllB [Marinococcus halophilus]GEK58880.1 allantoinase [Marinococcus halophilus]